MYSGGHFELGHRDGEVIGAKLAPMVCMNWIGDGVKWVVIIMESSGNDD
jgi:hypothetical protein